MSIVQTIVSGRLTEPRYETLNSGKRILELTVAADVDAGRGPSGERQTETQFYNFAFWDEKADEFAQRLMFVKGQYVTVIGTVRIKPYAKQSGELAVNLTFNSGFDFTIGMRPAGAPQILPKNQAPQGYNNQGYAPPQQYQQQQQQQPPQGYSQQPYPQQQPPQGYSQQPYPQPPSNQGQGPAAPPPNPYGRPPANNG